MTEGVQDENIRDYATIDATETGGVYEGYALEYLASKVVISNGGGNYAGLAMLVEDTNPAVAGQKVGLDHWGVRKAYDGGVDVLALGDPVKIDSANPGKFKKWVAGTDTEDMLIGYVARTKDTAGVFMLRVIGGR